MIRILLISALALGYFQSLCCCEDWNCELSAAEADNPQSGCCASAPESETDAPFIPNGCEGDCEGQFCGDSGESLGMAAAIVPGDRSVAPGPSLEKEVTVAVPSWESQEVENATVPVKATDAPLYQVHCVYLL